MNRDQILGAFDRIGDTPDAIQQFRKLVVGLAIAGRFGSAGEDDMPPLRLAELIDGAKQTLMKQGSLRREKPWAKVTHEELPRGLPPVGQYIRLGAVARIEKGSTGIKGATQGSFPLVVTAEGRLTCDHFDLEGPAAIIPLVSSAGHGKASLQRLHYQEGRFALGSILAAILPHAPDLISARFVFEYLTAFKDELLVSRMIGTANVSLSIGKLGEVPLPLVAPTVQRRVDQFMALCDRLEAVRTTREAARDRLSATSLARLSAPDSESFKADAFFPLKTLSALVARPDQIKQIRQAILRLAVRGKVVRQDPTDELASKLLKLIDSKRANLLRSGYPNPGEARAQSKKLAEQVIPDGLEALPVGWTWATLSQCSLLVVDCKNKTAPYSYSGVRLIRTTNVRGGQMNQNDQKYVDQKTADIWSARCTPEAGDILITREAPMGEVCLIPPGEIICLGQRMMLARLLPETIDSKFMIYSLRDPDLLLRVQDKPIGATVQHLRVGGVETLLIPLPPLAEQRRIAAKVDELMDVCDRLEAGLVASAVARGRLLDALLVGALAPAEVRELKATE